MQSFYLKQLLLLLYAKKDSPTLIVAYSPNW